MVFSIENDLSFQPTETLCNRQKYELACLHTHNKYLRRIELIAYLSYHKIPVPSAALNPTQNSHCLILHFINMYKT